MAKYLYFLRNRWPTFLYTPLWVGISPAGGPGSPSLGVSSWLPRGLFYPPVGQSLSNWLFELKNQHPSLKRKNTFGEIKTCNCQIININIIYTIFQFVLGFFFWFHVAFLIRVISKCSLLSGASILVLNQKLHPIFLYYLFAPLF